MKESTLVANGVMLRRVASGVAARPGDDEAGAWPEEDLAALRRGGLRPREIDHLRRRMPGGLLPLQRRALREAALLDAAAPGRSAGGGDSLVVLAPTTAGKTLLAELACWAAAARGERAIYLAPTRALAGEVHARLAAAGRELGRRVLLSTAEHHECDGLVAAGVYDVAVMIYEKLRSLMVQHRRLLDGVGLIVADELQSVGEPGRGEEIDLLLTAVRRRAPDARLLGLSGVLERSAGLERWLGARVLRDRRRPVELREGVFELASGLYRYRDEGASGAGAVGVVDAKEERLIEADIASFADPENFCEQGTLALAAALAREHGEQVLIFVPRRDMARAWALRLARLLADEFVPPDALLESIRRGEESRMCEDLAACAEAGVAFHHAALPGQLRALVETAYSRGELRLLVATSTLAQGVNLSGRYVISLPGMIGGGASPDDAPSMGRLSRERFGNQGGRAGRLGRSDAGAIGRSIVVAADASQAEQYWRELIAAPLPDLESPLPRWNLEQAALAALALEGESSIAGLAERLGATLGGLADRVWSAALPTALEAALASLAAAELVAARAAASGERRYRPTAIGEIVARMGILPATASMWRDWLEGLAPGESPSALEALLVAASTPDARLVGMPLGWRERSRVHYLSLLRERIEAEMGVAGGELPRRLEPFLAPVGGASRADLAAAKKALALAAWIGPEPTRELEERFGVYAGLLANLGREARWLVEAAAALAEALAHPPDIAATLTAVARRLPLGLTEEAAGLSPLEPVCLTRAEAAALTREGFDTIDALAEAMRRGDDGDLLARLLGGPRATAIAERVGHLTRAARLGEAAKLRSAPRPGTDERSEPVLRLARASPGEVRLMGCDFELPPIAYRLLQLLAERPGECIRYEQIESALWDYPPAREQIHQHKNVLLGAMREAAGEAAERLLVTVRRFGLKLDLRNDQIELASV